jgi:hypothetical protein
VWQRAVWLSSLMLASIALSQESYHVIPLRPDPAFALDGDLSDWAEIGNGFTIDHKEQVHHGPDTWKNPDDLSADVKLAWRSEGLYLAAQVTDSAFYQNQRGTMMWKGDHLELYVDATPDADVKRLDLGKGQYQFGLSPGNFKHTGDKLADITSEAVGYRPDGLDASTARVASVRTADGYTIEALIPWTILYITPKPNLPISMEVGISDTDSPEPRQETYMTIRTDRWQHKRNRLVAMLLGNADGLATPPTRKAPIKSELNMGHGLTQSVEFEMPPVPDGKTAVLTFKGRIAYSKPAGYAPCLELVLNTRQIDGKRLQNRPMTSTYRYGRTMNFVTGDGLIALCYGPDFEAVDKDQHYGLVDTDKACEYGFDVTDLVKKGRNRLELRTRADKRGKWHFHFADLAVEFRAPKAAEDAPKPAPTGPLPFIHPKPPSPHAYSLEEKEPLTLAVTVSNETFAVTSRFSAPDGTWVRGSSPFFRHERRVEKADEAVVVFDSFTNLTDEPVPIMQRHECQLGKRLVKRWLAGLSPHTPDVSMAQPATPISFAITRRAGVGLMPMNDEFQVHIVNYSLGDTIGMADNSFVLKPGGTYTAEWQVVPVPTPDFWDFVNAARRLRGANFTLPYQFAFLSARKHNDSFLKQFVDHKTPHVVCASIGYPRYKGMYAHGTAFQYVDHGAYTAHNTRIDELFPDVHTSIYFHCFLEVIDGGDRTYPGARVLRPDGTQANYGKPYDKIFFPTLRNRFGKDIAKNLDAIWGACGADGTYWDELEYSAYQYHYGEPWDGCSGDIDRGKHTLKRLKSSVTLLSQPWRVAQVKRCLEQGPFVANGQPHTRTIAALNLQRFVETASISNCLRAILYSPIALGDHIAERTEVDAYRWMLKALDYGCVYNWYPERIATGYPTLAAYMFPITPIELHEGFIIGKERILTNRSGCFGWGDASTHVVHVFNGSGKEVPDHPVPTLSRDGRTYSEVRIAEGWSAAIVRQ